MLYRRHTWQSSCGCQTDIVYSAPVPSSFNICAVPYFNEQHFDSKYKSRKGTRTALPYFRFHNKTVWKATTVAHTAFDVFHLNTDPVHKVDTNTNFFFSSNAITMSSLEMQSISVPRPPPSFVMAYAHPCHWPRSLTCKTSLWPSVAFCWGPSLSPAISFGQTYSSHATESPFSQECPLVHSRWEES